MTQPLQSSHSNALSGTVSIPGDKSISHRALMLASQAVGRTQILGLLEGEDVLHTASALRLMGVTIDNETDGTWWVDGVGVGGLSEPENILDMGNSGTATRLLMGLVAPYHFDTVFTGDTSLRSRPMQRVIVPLEAMGIQCSSREGGRLPLTVHGREDCLPITYTLPVASAQVKSAILLAGLNIRGITTIIEPHATRDHTERMLQYFGAEITTSEEEAGRHISLTGQPELKAKHIQVPGDPSSAAFAMVAALIVPDSDVTLKHVCMNETRTGLITTLQEMGGDIDILNKREEGGEDVADIRVKHSFLRGVAVPEERAPSMIDEYPVLAIAASVAQGDTHMRGVQELRVKESDRLAAVEAGLAENGVQTKSTEDSLTIHGSAGETISGGGEVKTHLDHRIAMSFLLLGLVTEKPVFVDDGSMIATSYPNFIEDMQALGACISVANG